MRTRMSKNVTKNMIKAGCFDGLHDNRKELLESCDFIADMVTKIRKKQDELEAEADPVRRKKLTESIESYKEKLENRYEPVREDKWQRLRDEQEVLGHFISEHPLDVITVPQNLKLNSISNLKSMTIRFWRMRPIYRFVTKSRWQRVRILRYRGQNRENILCML